MKKKKVLLVSCSVIMLCICIIAGMSYALFTDSVSVGNHLKAGTLDVKLTRTDLEYCVLNSVGELEVISTAHDLDLTTSTDTNVFGIDSTDIRIVPGSYFDADLKITNNGDTAFRYSISIKMLGDSNALAEQLKVTVTHPDGTTTVKMLSEIVNGLEIDTGKMKVGDREQRFSVRVDFVDDVDYNDALPTEATEDDRMDNDEAQTQTAVFDLIVTAVQATTQD